MKGKMVSVFLIMLTVFLNAQELLWFPMDSTWFGANTGKKSTVQFIEYNDFKIIIYNKFLFFLNNTDNYDNFKSLLYEISEIIIDSSTGYRYYNAKHLGSKENTRIYLLQSKDYIIIIEKKIENNVVNLMYGFDHIENYKKSIEEMIEHRRRARVGDGFFEYEYIDSGIKSVDASSYLTETIANKMVDYKPAYLINRICKLQENIDVSFPIFDNFMRCWAEGVPGDGIGQWLEVEFTRFSDEIMILNGYVDFRNMSAYKNNNRLKKIRVESEQPKFSIEYTLPDYVAYHSVPLPQKTKKVKITILEVYKGLKYDDTCVTAIALPQERTRSIEEEKQEVIQYLRKIHVFEYLERYKKEIRNKN
ncbi:NADase-type glycan-binding domain-containing protein [Gracilinema caldarium]|uniref:NAD glycohydrolase translocation F5/8 type C domain-containing protein n=1 Tax=Gracilinema caldarium (strain ATCC 51460 / DSM 7334 / H1) TaxID=744872 RepID=F8EYZ7_GRAC1|nr:hypothetical protein [Gracilinema caldarium]AEJ19228.1 hypothetical protein Spica_1080 [Gracilinema caldarium DSM 7334]